ncbi:MAG: exodeoxyribonuclease I [Hyphomicrobiales bacterium]|nr:exodeoxyribonuclease I [Hyphomicrobiales bacterium]
MAIVFYDVETTGTNTSFDQILQFAAIKTDSELNELERFEIRCRLQPHIVPAPQAMRVTRRTIAHLTDPALPSHYEMVRAIRGKLLSWSPALFVAYNSYRFDEHLLRQALYQTLHPCFLTNTGGNVRTDVMRMVQAASIYAPAALTIPLDQMGLPGFGLERVARANGWPHVNAHDALADAEATVHLCRLLQENAPDVWSSFMRLSQKAAVLDCLGDEAVLSMSAIYRGRAYSWLVTALGPNATNSSEFYVFELGHDPDAMRGLGDEELAVRLCSLPRPIHVVKCNGSPILMPAYDAPDTAPSKCLGTDELERRAAVLRSDPALCTRLIAAYESTREARTPSVHVEERIYDGFVKSADEARMEQFHNAPWEDRAGIVEQFDDARLVELGRRLIYIERPDVLSEAQRRSGERAIAKRLAGQIDGVAWLTFGKGIEEADGMLAAVLDDADRELLGGWRAYLEERRRQAATMLDEAVG